MEHLMTNRKVRGWKVVEIYRYERGSRKNISEWETRRNVIVNQIGHDNHSREKEQKEEKGKIMKANFHVLFHIW